MHSTFEIMSEPPSDEGRARSDSDARVERAGELLAEALGQGRGEIDGAALDALCAAHPELEAALRQLHAACRAVGHVLEERHRSRPRGLPPSPGPRHPESPPVRLLERLAGRQRPYQRYRIEGEVGRGGMGVVRKVWDDDLQRPLAMKLARRGLASESDSRALARFLEEAQITSQLNHPGIVPVHELGLDEEGEPYFTMQLVRGRTLAQIFDGREGQSPARVANLLLKVCEAMAYAHHKGVIHRDLKPANVMVGRFGEVLVMDWGLARVLAREDTRDLRVAPPEATERLHTSLRSPDSSLYTMDGDVVGTPAYMSPEQADGDLGELGSATDVYAAGAMLYHALAGRPPYLEPDERVPARAVWRRVQKGPPRPLAEVAPRAPAPLVALCERAMARLPSQRLPSMQEFADELRAFLDGRVVASYQSGPWAEAVAWCRRNRGVAIASVGLLAVLVGSGFVVADKERGRLEVVERERVLDEWDVDGRRAEELLAEADELWPLDPDTLPAMDAWLAEVDAWLGKHAGASAQLAELRARGRARPGAVQRRPAAGALLDAEVLGVAARKIASELEAATTALDDLTATRPTRATSRPWRCSGPRPRSSTLAWPR